MQATGAAQETDAENYHQSGGQVFSVLASESSIGSGVVFEKNHHSVYEITLSVAADISRKPHGN
jgi:hypothetical protein